MPTRRGRGRPPYPDVLTPVEWRVVDAVRHGMTNRQIAERRGVSLDAVKYHVANALQKLGLSHRRELRRWTGVARASALGARESKMNAQVAIGQIGQIARTVKDIEAARRWYGEVLGLAHLYSFGPLAFFDCAGTRLFLEQGEAGKPGNSILYFRVADIRAAYEALSSRGVEFINAPHLIHRHDDGMEEWMAFFKDHEGQTLAIMAQVRPQSI